MRLDEMRLEVIVSVYECIAQTEFCASVHPGSTIDSRNRTEASGLTRKHGQGNALNRTGDLKSQTPLMYGTSGTKGGQAQRRRLASQAAHRAPLAGVR